MSPSSLYRTAGAVGLACAVLLVVNVARRAGWLPVALGDVAPLAPLAGLFALTGFYAFQRVPSGRLGLLAYGLNAAGLAGAFAIEYTLHFVFPYLPSATVTDLLAGPTGAAFTGTAVVLILGVLAFGVASWRARILPAVAVALYVLGMVPGSLRAAVPLPVYLGGLLLAAVGVGWLSLALLRVRRHRENPA